MKDRVVRMNLLGSPRGAQAALERENRLTRAMVNLGPLSDERAAEVQRRQQMFSGMGRPMPDVLALESVADDVVAGRLL